MFMWKGSQCLHMNLTASSSHLALPLHLTSPCQRFDLVAQPWHVNECPAHLAWAATGTVLWLIAFSLFPPARTKPQMQWTYIWYRNHLGSDRNLALSPTYFIGFIKQACESEVPLCSTHIYHCFLQRAKHSCPDLLMGSMATLLHQMLLALKPGPHRVREKAQIQQAPSWASSLKSPLLEGFGPAFSATTFQPTPCQLLFPEGDLIYGTLHIVLSCHLHNLSPVSDNTLLKQFIVKPVFYKGITRKKSQGGREGQEGEKDDLWGCP